MKIIAFGDIHRLVAPSLYERVIEEERPDRIIFLGDYFDDEGDGPEEAQASARWLLDGLKDPRRLFLLGNHDLAYLFPAHPQAHVLKGVFTDKKLDAVKSVICGMDHPFELGFYEAPFLFTHAGWRKVFAHFNPLVFTRARAAIQNGTQHDFFSWGKDTRGPDKVDGPLWARPDEDMLLSDITQVFGHTHFQEPLVLLSNSGDSFAIGIDCRQRWNGPQFYFIGFSGGQPRAELRRIDGTLLLDLTAIGASALASHRSSLFK